MSGDLTREFRDDLRARSDAVLADTSKTPAWAKPAASLYLSLLDALEASETDRAALLAELEHTREERDEAVARDAARLDMHPEVLAMEAELVALRTRCDDAVELLAKLVDAVGSQRPMPTMSIKAAVARANARAFLASVPAVPSTPEGTE